jgi:hypothetical protein
VQNVIPPPDRYVASVHGEEAKLEELHPLPRDSIATALVPLMVNGTSVIEDEEDCV